jgi:hypothetical protein
MEGMRKVYEYENGKRIEKYIPDEEYFAVLWETVQNAQKPAVIINGGGKEKLYKNQDAFNQDVYERSKFSAFMQEHWTFLLVVGTALTGLVTFLKQINII